MRFTEGQFWNCPKCVACPSIAMGTGGKTFVDQPRFILKSTNSVCRSHFFLSFSKTLLWLLDSPVGKMFGFPQKMKTEIGLAYEGASSHAQPDNIHPTLSVRPTPNQTTVTC